MQNKNKSCIFEHYGFVYVCDFENMLMWVVSPEDSEDDDPATPLDLRREDGGEWYYSPHEENNFRRDSDTELVERIEDSYKKYLNTMIVGNNGRPQNLPPSLESKRVRKTSVVHKV